MLQKTGLHLDCHSFAACILGKEWHNHNEVLHTLNNSLCGLTAKDGLHKVIKRFLWVFVVVMVPIRSHRFSDIE